MWEALCFAAPWGGVKEKKVRKKVMKGDRPPVDKKYISGAPEGYVELMKQSWAQKARKRPTFTRIFNKLQTMRIELEQMEEEQGETKVSRIENDDDSRSIPDNFLLDPNTGMLRKQFLHAFLHASNFCSTA